MREDITRTAVIVKDNRTVAGPSGKWFGATSPVIESRELAI